QTMEVQADRKADVGKNGRTIGVSRPTYDECRAINVILKPLELPDHGNESLHHVLTSPTGSGSSSGSWSPTRRLYAIIGAPAEVEPEAPQYGAGQPPAAGDDPPREDEEDRRTRVAKGWHVKE